MNLTKSLLKVNSTVLKCPIGFHAEERIIGNDFCVEIIAKSSINLNQMEDNSLNSSVDYEKISTIIKKEMQKENLFIETVCKNIFLQVKNLSEQHLWTVKIKKLSVPLNNILNTEFLLTDD